MKHAYSAHKKEKDTDIEQDFEQEKEGRNVQTQITWPYQTACIEGTGGPRIKRIIAHHARVRFSHTR